MLPSFWVNQFKNKNKNEIEKKTVKLNKEWLNALFCTVLKNSTNSMSLVTLKCLSLLFIRAMHEKI